MHPLVAVVAIVAITLLCLSAEQHSGEPLVSLKIFAVSVIGLICGIKLRHILPVT
ncbi:MAG: hypothetical protein QW356_05385 [Candidatus Hadarchaeales archaeon]